MTIAEKLTTIAENMQKVYDAGKPQYIYIGTVGFDNWRTETTVDSLVPIKHELGVKPRFVALIPNNMAAIETATPPQNITSILCQVDATCYHNEDTDTDVYYPANFIRWRDNAYSSSARIVGDGSNRLITGWDENNIYVNPNGSAETFPPSSVTTFTLICLK